MVCELVVNNERAKSRLHYIVMILCLYLAVNMDSQLISSAIQIVVSFFSCAFNQSIADEGNHVMSADKTGVQKDTAGNMCDQTFSENRIFLFR